jgi:hypothetical protein
VRSSSGSDGRDVGGLVVVHVRNKSLALVAVECAMNRLEEAFDRCRRFRNGVKSAKTLTLTAYPDPRKKSLANGIHATRKMLVLVHPFSSEGAYSAYSAYSADASPAGDWR